MASLRVDGQVTWHIDLATLPRVIAGAWPFVATDDPSFSIAADGKHTMQLRRALRLMVQADVIEMYWAPERTIRHQIKLRSQQTANRKDAKSQLGVTLRPKKP